MRAWPKCCRCVEPCRNTGGQLCAGARIETSRSGPDPRGFRWKCRRWRWGDLAAVLAAAVPGSALRATGFLAAKEPAQSNPVMHLNTIVNFSKETENGLQAQNQVQEEGRPRRSWSVQASQVLPLHRGKIEEVDYKDVDILKDFITENAKIMPARITGARRVTSVSCRLPSSAPASWPDAYTDLHQ